MPQSNAGKPHPRWTRLITTFLGPDAAAGGANALLGVPESAVNDAGVIEALRRRLAEIDSHELSESSQAEEVRLALHAAAARLLMPVGVGALAGPVAPEEQTTEDADSPPLSPFDSALAHDALIVLARHGGWSPQCPLELGRLAAARGISPAEAPRVVMSLIGHASKRRTSPMKPASAPNAAPSAVSSPPRDVPHRSMLPIVGAALSLIALGVFVLLLLPIGGGTPTQRGGTAIETADEELRDPDPRATTHDDTKPAPSFSASVPPQRAAVTINRGAALITSGAASFADVAPAMQAAASNWHTLDTGTRRAIEAAVIELYFASPVETREWIALSAETGGLVSRVWATGMLARISRERGPTLENARANDAALARVLGFGVSLPSPDWESGAAAALSSEVDKWLMTSPGNATRWLELVGAASVGSAEAERAVREALAAVVLEGPEPDRDAGSRDAVAALVKALSWRAPAPERAWLLEAFGDPRVTNADINALTEALVNSSAPGVLPTMTLPGRALEAQRRDLAARYAQQWGMSTESRTVSTPPGWSERLDEESRRLDHAATFEDYAASLVSLARLNALAGSHWEGAANGSQIWLEPFVVPEARGTGASSSGLFHDEDSDGWALRFRVAEKSAEERRSLLRSLAARNRVGRADASIAVNFALAGRPASVRETAVETVQSLSADPAIVNALLLQSPGMPASNTNKRLVDIVTGRDTGPVNRPQWRTRVRRALVGRLLELTAGDAGSVDLAVEALAEAYDARAGLPSPDDTPAPTRLGRASAAIGDRWMSDARKTLSNPPIGVTLREVEASLASRQLVANDSVQAFVARQLANCELMAFLVALERPARFAEVRTVLDDLDKSRAGAFHVLEQAAYAERAQSMLWSIRFNDGEGPS